MDATLESTLASINRRLEENQWRITRCDPSLRYYVVRGPLRAGCFIEATEFMKVGDDFKLSVSAQLPMPEVPTPITETEDGFVLNFRDVDVVPGFVRLPGAMRFRYGFADCPSRPSPATDQAEGDGE
jgi:hypothetical protein